jgi:hypothetical protein
MSGEWIGVVLITALLVVLVAYSVFLAFRDGRRPKTDHGERHSKSQDAHGQEAGARAA